MQVKSLTTHLYLHYSNQKEKSGSKVRIINTLQINKKISKNNECRCEARIIERGEMMIDPQKNIIENKISTGFNNVDIMG